MSRVTTERRQEPAPDAAHRRRLGHARTIARWLDDYLLDPIIGLVVPGGDMLTAVVGMYLVYTAARAGVSKLVVARMIVNLAIDMAVGAVPLVGDIFDLAFRANRKNLALLERSLAPGGVAGPGGQRPQERLRDGLVLVGAGLAFLLALALPLLVLVWFISWVRGQVGGG